MIPVSILLARRKFVGLFRFASLAHTRLRARPREHGIDEMGIAGMLCRASCDAAETPFSSQHTHAILRKLKDDLPARLRVESLQPDGIVYSLEHFRP